MARWVVGSNSPVTRRGTRQAYAARTLWAAIIGKRSPSATTIGAATPVSAVGRTTCSGTATAPRRSAALCQWTRNRFRASGASGSTPASPARAAAGIVGGSISCGEGRQDRPRLAEPADRPLVGRAVGRLAARGCRHPSLLRGDVGRPVARRILRAGPERNFGPDGTPRQRGGAATILSPTGASEGPVGPRLQDRGRTMDFILNGRPVSIEAEPGTSLLELLRERFGLRSMKDGCAPEGSCGACTVLVDGRPVVSCARDAERCAGREVVTLEGLPPDVRSAWADAFVATGASQCGFCSPGIVMKAEGLLARDAGARRATRSPGRWPATSAAARAT